MQRELLDIITSVLGIEGKQRGDEFDISCPVHADRKPSAGVNLETGLWHCFVCGAGGTLADLAMAVKGIDFASAKRLIEPNTPDAMIARLHSQARTALQRYSRPKPVQLPGPYPQEHLGYLLKRGFTPETLSLYEAGYVERETFRTASRSYSIRDYVALPIRSASKHLLAYCYRNTNPGPLRYLYTPGAPLASMWFGVHLYPRGGEIVVTEGALDSMWIAQCGRPAIAALGANAEFKSSHLLRYQRVVLFMDRDAAGVHAAERIGGLVADRMPVLVARYPRGVDAKDPAELKPRQVRRAIARAIPYKQWKSWG